MICAACKRGLSFEHVQQTMERLQTYKDVHHATKEEFLEAVSTGCILCTALYDSMSDDQRSRINSDGPTRYVIGGSSYFKDTILNTEHLWDWKLQVAFIPPNTELVSKKFVLDFESGLSMCHSSFCQSTNH